MKIFPIAVGLALVAATISVSCDKLHTPTPTLQPSPVATHKPVQANDERTSFAQTTQREINELRDSIAALKVKAESASSDIRARLIEEVARLESDRVDAQQQLARLRVTSIESWNRLKETLRSSLDRLKAAVQNAHKGPV
jgi:chromosome segregation ATPase